MTCKLHKGHKGEGHLIINYDTGVVINGGRDTVVRQPMYGRWLILYKLTKDVDNNNLLALYLNYTFCT